MHARVELAEISRHISSPQWSVCLACAVMHGQQGVGVGGEESLGPPLPVTLSGADVFPLPPALHLTPSELNRIWTPLPLPALSLKTQDLIRLLHHWYNCRFFFKASSKRQMFGLIKNRGGNLQLHQGIIYWTNILIKNMKRSARPCKVFCFKKIFIKPLFYGFNKQNPLPHGIFCWPHTRENKMVIQGNAFDFYCG